MSGAGCAVRLTCDNRTLYSAAVSDRREAGRPEKRIWDAPVPYLRLSRRAASYVTDKLVAAGVKFSRVYREKLPWPFFRPLPASPRENKNLDLLLPSVASGSVAPGAFSIAPLGKEDKLMLHHRRFPNVVFGASLRPESAALAIMVLLLFLLFVFLFMTLTAPPVQAQTFKVIYNFTGGQDGAVPYTGLTMDQAGNFYGTTLGGGSAGNGTVFRLSRKGSGWVLTPLYSFQGGTDGAIAYARVVFGPDGSLYGTTAGGGYYVGSCADFGCGTVYNLKPAATVPPAALSPWEETVLYRFSDGSDGASPGTGNLVFDQAGNLYGTTTKGGSQGVNCASYCGTIYELTLSKGSWTESVLYAFTNSADGERLGAA